MKVRQLEIEIFRGYEDSFPSCTGIESHKGLWHYGLYNAVLALDDRTV